MSNIKVLVIAPHPDDAEIFMGGTIAYLKDIGCSISILDLTKGELSTRGSTLERMKEAEKASNILNIDKRICADLHDGGIQANSQQTKTLVTLIREAQPDILFAPYFENRHPDHNNTHLLVKDAIFMSNLRKYPDNKGQAPHLVPSVFWYMARAEFKPSFIVDITKFKVIKDNAVNAYQSQVKPKPSTESQTLIGSDLSLHAIAARDGYYGSMIGVQFGEPFYHDGPLVNSEKSILETPQNSYSRFIYPND